MERNIFNNDAQSITTNPIRILMRICNVIPAIKKIMVINNLLCLSNLLNNKYVLCPVAVSLIETHLSDCTIFINKIQQELLYLHKLNHRVHRGHRELFRKTNDPTVSS